MSAFRVSVLGAAVGCALLTACESGPTSLTEPALEPAFITNGSLDGNQHPAVVLILLEVGGAPAFRCSGTMIAPKIVLTAGHCAGAPGEFSGMRIFTESDVDNGDNNYPYAGPNSIEAVSWQAYPGYNDAEFWLHDVGVVVLRKPYILPKSKYGELPAPNQLDALKPSASTLFTSVGYGLQQVNSAFSTGLRIRMFAEPHLDQINSGSTGDYSLLLSNNANTGGTCFGDSGGPNYLGSSNVIAGVTSYGLNGSCGGTGGVFRLDRPDVLAFVSSFLK